MTDRELLELAAKAAGIKVNAKRQAERDAEGMGHHGLWTTTATNWNPLINDGDAFRLASAMGMTVEFGNNLVLYPGDVGGDGTDPLEATRQAIVKAAAEIGKAMP